jgi:hypothetical protein
MKLEEVVDMVLDQHDEYVGTLEQYLFARLGVSPDDPCVAPAWQAYHVALTAMWSDAVDAAYHTGGVNGK